MDNLDHYIMDRKKDTEFTQGYFSFKIDVFLAEGREEANLSLEEVADRLCIGLATIQSIESNTEEFAIDQLN